MIGRIIARLLKGKSEGQKGFRYSSLTTWGTRDPAGRQTPQDAKGMCFDNCAHGVRVLVDADDAQHVTLGEDNLLLLWLAGNKGADN